MGYRLEISDEALGDLGESFKWYESKIEGLGSMFVNEVENTIGYISKYPELFNIKHKEPYREAIVRTFPFVIIYEFLKKENKIIIFSIFHCKIDPSKKP